MPVRLRSAGLLLAAAQAACWQRVPTVNVFHRHLHRGAASYLRVGPPAAAAQAPESDSGMQSPPPPKVAPMEQLRLFWRLAKPYFTEAEGAKTGFALLLALTLLNSGVSVLFSYTSRDFYTALSSKDQSQFYVLTGRFALALAAATPVSVLYRFQRQRLAIAWREWMTMEVARQYYADRAYYQISLTKDIDNPDQRIAEDVKARRHALSHSATRRATSASELAPRSQRAIAHHHAHRQACRRSRASRSISSSRCSPRSSTSPHSRRSSTQSTRTSSTSSSPTPVQQRLRTTCPAQLAPKLVYASRAGC